MDEDVDLTEADELKARPHLLEALDVFDSEVRMGLRHPECDAVVARLREIEVIIGRRPPDEAAPARYADVMLSSTGARIGTIVVVETGTNPRHLEVWINDGLADKIEQGRHREYGPDEIKMMDQHVAETQERRARGEPD